MSTYDQTGSSSMMNVDDDKLAAEDREIILSYPASQAPKRDNIGNFSTVGRNALAFLLFDILDKFNLPTQNISDCRSFLRKNPSLESQLAELWERGQGFRAICSHPKLQPPRRSSNDIIIENAAIAATERSWECTFQGDSAAALLTTIRSYLQRREVHSPCALIVNSSGMGKSRMVDELGRTVIVVPMCLRNGTDGFPPPDVNLRTWLMDSTSQDERTKKAHALLFALFTTTHEALKTIIHSLSCEAGNRRSPSMSAIANCFRLHITQGQSFQRHGSYRKNFYNRVIELATEFILKAVQDKSCVESFPRYVTFSESQRELNATFDLIEFLRNYDSEPLIVFAFDESHDLATVPPSSDSSMFIEIRHALRLVHSHSIFSFFLSTTGKFQVISPPHRYEPSGRIVGGTLRTLPPITETGFDQLARRAKEGQLALETVTGLEFMSHLGRPLFGSRWDAGDKIIRENILDFAKRKLLGTNNYIDSDNAQSLACLAVRLALEFRPVTHEHRDIELKQIERHMRVCLGADPGFERMVSVAASEPLLAEAAADVRILNPAHELISHFDVWGIDRGSRGELAAMLLVLQARDKACQSRDRRYLTVTEFMQALLPEHYHAELLSSATHSSRTMLPSMNETFKNSHIWFNHFIKVHDYDIINVEYLWRVAVRGAAILCADNQRGVDLVIPIVYSGTKLQRSNMTAILIQVKNDKSFRTSVKEYLFQGLDPYDFGLFSSGEGHPVIRMVFALASGVTAVKIFSPRRRSTRLNPAPGAASDVTYDIWVAGLSSDVLRPINKDNINDFKALLSPYSRVIDMYTPTDENDEIVKTARGNLRREANPATVVDDIFFSRYLDLSQQEQQEQEMIGQ